MTWNNPGSGSAVDLTPYQAKAQKGVANGYPDLDSAGRVPLAQLPSVTAAATGVLYLTRDFGLSPDMDPSVLTTGINDAIQSSMSAGRPLSLGADTWPVDGPIVIDGPLITLRGEGVLPLYGSLLDGVNIDTMNMPMVPPYLQGAGIKQMTAGQNAINLTASGYGVSLRDFGILFDDTISFTNTGHGVNATPPSYFEGGLDHGVMGAKWDNLITWGHDGNHYGYVIVNVLYGTFTHLHSFGGGALLWDNNAPTAQGQVRTYGGSVITHLYGQVVTGGTAHGMYMKATNSVPNGSIFVRPQLTVQDIGASTRATLGIPGPATTAQKIVKFDGTTRWWTILQPDWETNINCTVDIPSTVKSIWIDPAGIIYSPSGQGDIMSETVFAGGGLKRRLTAGFETIVTSAETNGAHVRTLSKDVTPNLTWGPTSDGDGRFTMGGPVETRAYTTGTRPSASTCPVGTQIFDSTLSKPVWSDGTVWRDAAGTAV